MTIVSKDLETIQKKDTEKWFQQLVQKSEYVGELFSINYENAKVQIHDNERRNVGGIPSLSFLIATRIDPDNAEIDFKEEDAGVQCRIIGTFYLDTSTEEQNVNSRLHLKFGSDLSNFYPFAYRGHDT